MYFQVCSNLAYQDQWSSGFLKSIKMVLAYVRFLFVNNVNLNLG